MANLENINTFKIMHPKCRDTILRTDCDSVLADVVEFEKRRRDKVKRMNIRRLSVLHTKKESNPIRFM